MTLWMTLWMIAALALAACSPPADSPEAEVRALVAQAQAAAEARNVRDLRGLIADEYADAQGHDRKAVENLIRLQVLRNQSVHLFTRIRDITFPEPDRATVSVAAALAGRPVARADDLVGLTADLYRFDLELVRQDGGEWRVSGAAWAPARLEDFW